MKAFIITISCLAAISIACVSTNLVVNHEVNKISGSSSVGAGEVVYDDEGNTVVVDENGNTVPATDANGNTVAATDANGNKVTTKAGDKNNNTNNKNQNNQNNQGGQKNQGSSVTPPGNSTAEIVNFYNNALAKTYAQSSFSVEKSESINLQHFDIILNGKPATGIQSTVDKVVNANAKPKHDTKTFSSNPAVDDKDRYILPIGLTAGDVASASSSRNGSGYVVTFKLAAENCDYTQRPPHNSSCTFPLDFSEIDFGAFGKITSADFYYPGTTLQATIDGSGMVKQVYVSMPLEVTNAHGTGLGQDISIDKISGTWTCTNTMS